MTTDFNIKNSPTHKDLFTRLSANFTQISTLKSLKKSSASTASLTTPVLKTISQLDHETWFRVPESFIDYAAEGEEPADLALLDLIPPDLALLNLPSAQAIAQSIAQPIAQTHRHAETVVIAVDEQVELAELIPQSLNDWSQRELPTLT
jgi:hypothetical protein